MATVHSLQRISEVITPLPSLDESASRYYRVIRVRNVPPQADIRFLFSFFSQIGPVLAITSTEGSKRIVYNGMGTNETVSSSLSRYTTDGESEHSSKYVLVEFFSVLSAYNSLMLDGFSFYSADAASHGRLPSISISLDKPAIHSKHLIEYENNIRAYLNNCFKIIQQSIMASPPRALPLAKSSAYTLFQLCAPFLSRMSYDGHQQLNHQSNSDFCDLTDTILSCLPLDKRTLMTALDYSISNLSSDTTILPQPIVDKSIYDNITVSKPPTKKDTIILPLYLWVDNNIYHRLYTNLHHLLLNSSPSSNTMRLYSNHHPDYKHPKETPPPFSRHWDELDRRSNSHFSASSTESPLRSDLFSLPSRDSLLPEFPLHTYRYGDKNIKYRINTVCSHDGWSTKITHSSIFPQFGSTRVNYTSLSSDIPSSSSSIPNTTNVQKLPGKTTYRASPASFTSHNPALSPHTVSPPHSPPMFPISSLFSLYQICTHPLPHFDECPCSMDSSLTKCIHRAPDEGEDSHTVLGGFRAAFMNRNTTTPDESSDTANPTNTEDDWQDYQKKTFVDDDDDDDNSQDSHASVQPLPTPVDRPVPHVSAFNSSLAGHVKVLAHIYSVSRSDIQSHSHRNSFSKRSPQIRSVPPYYSPLVPTITLMQSYTSTSLTPQLKYTPSYLSSPGSLSDPQIKASILQNRSLFASYISLTRPIDSNLLVSSSSSPTQSVSLSTSSTLNIPTIQSLNSPNSSDHISLTSPSSSLLHQISLVGRSLDVSFLSNSARPEILASRIYQYMERYLRINKTKAKILENMAQQAAIIDIRIEDAILSDTYDRDTVEMYDTELNMTTTSSLDNNYSNDAVYDYDLYNNDSTLHDHVYMTQLYGDGDITNNDDDDGGDDNDNNTTNNEHDDEYCDNNDPQSEYNDVGPIGESLINNDDGEGNGENDHTPTTLTSITLDACIHSTLTDDDGNELVHFTQSADWTLTQFVNFANTDTFTNGGNDSGDDTDQYNEYTAENKKRPRLSDRSKHRSSPDDNETVQLRHVLGDYTIDELAIPCHIMDGHPEENDTFDIISDDNVGSEFDQGSNRILPSRSSSIIPRTHSSTSFSSVTTSNFKHDPLIDTTLLDTTANIFSTDLHYYPSLFLMRGCAVDTQGSTLFLTTTDYTPYPRPSSNSVPSQDKPLSPVPLCLPLTVLSHPLAYTSLQNDSIPSSSYTQSTLTSSLMQSLANPMHNVPSTIGLPPSFHHLLNSTNMLAYISHTTGIPFTDLQPSVHQTSLSSHLYIRRDPSVQTTLSPAQYIEYQSPLMSLSSDLPRRHILSQTSFSSFSCDPKPSVRSITASILKQPSNDSWLSHTQSNLVYNGTIQPPLALSQAELLSSISTVCEAVLYPSLFDHFSSLAVACNRPNHHPYSSSQRILWEKHLDFMHSREFIQSTIAFYQSMHSQLSYISLKVDSVELYEQQSKTRVSKMIGGPWKSSPTWWDATTLHVRHPSLLEPLARIFCLLLATFSIPNRKAQHTPIMSIIDIFVYSPQPDNTPMSFSSLPVTDIALDRLPITILRIMYTLVGYVLVLQRAPLLPQVQTMPVLTKTVSDDTSVHPDSINFLDTFFRLLLMMITRHCDPTILLRFLNPSISTSPLDQFSTWNHQQVELHFSMPHRNHHLMTTLSESTSLIMSLRRPSILREDTVHTPQITLSHVPGLIASSKQYIVAPRHIHSDSQYTHLTSFQPDIFLSESTSSDFLSQLRFTPHSNPTTFIRFGLTNPYAPDSTQTSTNDHHFPIPIYGYYTGTQLFPVKEAPFSRDPIHNVTQFSNKNDGRISLDSDDSIAIENKTSLTIRKKVVTKAKSPDQVNINPKWRNVVRQIGPPFPARHLPMPKPAYAAFALAQPFISMASLQVTVDPQAIQNNFTPRSSLCTQQCRNRRDAFYQYVRSQRPNSTEESVRNTLRCGDISKPICIHYGRIENPVCLQCYKDVVEDHHSHHSRLHSQYPDLSNVSRPLPIPSPPILSPDATEEQTKKDIDTYHNQCRVFSSLIQTTHPPLVTQFNGFSSIAWIPSPYMAEYDYANRLIINTIARLQKSLDTLQSTYIPPLIDFMFTINTLSHIISLIHHYSTHELSRDQEQPDYVLPQQAPLSSQESDFLRESVMLRKQSTELWDQLAQTINHFSGMPQHPQQFGTSEQSNIPPQDEWKSVIDLISSSQNRIDVQQPVPPSINACSSSPNISPDIFALVLAPPAPNLYHSLYNTNQTCTVSETNVASIGCLASRKRFEPLFYSGYLDQYIDWNTHCSQVISDIYTTIQRVYTLCGTFLSFKTAQLKKVATSLLDRFIQSSDTDNSVQSHPPLSITIMLASLGCSIDWIQALVLTPPLLPTIPQSVLTSLRSSFTALLPPLFQPGKPRPPTSPWIAPSYKMSSDTIMKRIRLLTHNRAFLHAASQVGVVSIAQNCPHSSEYTHWIDEMTQTAPNPNSHNITTIHTIPSPYAHMPFPSSRPWMFKPERTPITQIISYPTLVPIISHIQRDVTYIKP